VSGRQSMHQPMPTNTDVKYQVKPQHPTPRYCDARDEACLPPCTTPRRRPPWVSDKCVTTNPDAGTPTGTSADDTTNSTP
jgi:hypothetical protein